MINPLEPRDALYGGRTEAFTLFQKDQDIAYVDVTSLYPYINKTGKIPIEHPEIVTEGFTDIQQYEGIIKCKILPPRGLCIPVLPVKMNNKLLFILGRTCSENHQQTPCQQRRRKIIHGNMGDGRIEESIGERICSSAHLRSVAFR